MKNHFRAHQLSVWLRLIPELHRAGMEDVVARHNLFRNHNDGELYDGVVRADPLSRNGPVPAAAGAELNRHLSNNGTVAEIISAPTTVTPETVLTTCTSMPANLHSNSSLTNVVDREIPAYTVNSTAFWITVGIGCTLLVLNLLIFASIYYQRDRSKMDSQKAQNSSIIGISTGAGGVPDPQNKNWSTEPNNYTRVDVESTLYQQSYMNYNQPGIQQRGNYGFNTLPTKAQLAKQQLMPNDLTSTLPCPSQLHHSTSSTFLHNSTGPPNGSVTMHLPVPKPPPVPRNKSPPETTPLIQQPSHANPNPILKVPTAAMSEMRV